MTKKTKKKRIWMSTRKTSEDPEMRRFPREEGMADGRCPCFPAERGKI
jgi:hypothetical protein